MNRRIALAAAGAAAVTLATGTALAADDTGNSQKTQGYTGSSGLIEQHREGVRLTEKAVSGAELLEADLLGSSQPVGTVEDAILNDVGAIEFLKYQTTRVRDLDEEGYLPVGDLVLQPSIGFGIDVDSSQTAALSPSDDINLTRRDLQTRMLSNMLRGHLLVDGNSYEIRDIAFDRNGKARYFIVGRTEGGFLQQGDAFAVPFDQTHYSDGAWRTGMGREDFLLLVTYVG